MAMEDRPTMIKMDQSENQGSPCRGSRCLPKALGYVMGDMKTFANWLKGIYASFPGDGRSGFGGNGLLALLLISLVIFLYILSYIYKIYINIYYIYLVIYTFYLSLSFPLFNFLLSDRQSSSSVFM